MKLTDKKRKDILDAAVAEFRAQGFVAARVNRIAESAGVSKRTLYKHFDSKEALFAAICAQVMEAAADAPVLRFDPARTIEAQLLEALRGYVARLTEPGHIALFRLMVSEFLRDPALSDDFFARAAAQENPITGLVTQAMAAGALRRADPAYAASQLLALVKAYFFWPEFLRGTPKQQDAEAVMADCVAMFLCHYAP